MVAMNKSFFDARTMTESENTQMKTEATVEEQIAVAMLLTRHNWRLRQEGDRFHVESIEGEFVASISYEHAYTAYQSYMYVQVKDDSFPGGDDLASALDIIARYYDPNDEPNFCSRIRQSLETMGKLYRS